MGIRKLSISLRYRTAVKNYAVPYNPHVAKQK